MKLIDSKKWFFLNIIFLATLATTPTQAAKEKKMHAVAEISGCTDPNIVGRAHLEEAVSDEGIKVVRVSMTVKGLAAGKHAVHIHEVGSCTPCGSAGGHFDPGPASNSNPDGNHPFHMGDLINLEVEGQVGTMRTKTSRITLSPGPLSIFDANGSAFIIHTNEDTYCPDGAVPGCAGGAREACGIIKVKN